MDVASSFAVSVAPPPFQKEVEEARRDTQNRVSIPKLQQSNASNAQSHIADERGNTEGENSLLNAQQMGISDAQDDLTVDPERQKRQRQRKQKQQEGDDEALDQALTEDDSRRYEDEGESNSSSSDYYYDGESAGYNPLTGYYVIPASRRYRRRSILLQFREQNVKFLDRFSDRRTAVGLINFALKRRYGSIIPHSRRGQVIERLA